MGHVMAKGYASTVKAVRPTSGSSRGKICVTLGRRSERTSRDSERIFFLCGTVLQREEGISSGEDIRRLLNTRMEMWIAEKYDEMLQEAERCDRKLKKLSIKDETDENVARIFPRLIGKGKLREPT
uniref:Siroheme synthase n=1 Tax=Lygus hesperus TaxID=30085 RepID=A0A0A9ZFC6_LYGHE